MPGPALELADIVRQHGDAYRAAHRLSLPQLRVLRAIAVCRTAALGGRVEQCGQCNFTRIVYNSCRNRHCPKCQSLARARWVQSRKEELLPVEYYHVVFTVPEPLAALAFQNPEVVYPILFGAAAETLLTIARDPKHLGAGIGFFSILHTWGQKLDYHPHLHCVVPGGGVAPDADRWVACKPGFFLSVRVLSRLFRRLFLEALQKAFARGQLRDCPAFDALCDQVRDVEWVVYAKPPFGGPQQVLEYLGCYTHRTAISNQRLLALQDGRVTFRWKDYRHPDQQKVMQLDAPEFLRRFLLHVLPNGFQRIRYYGLLAHCHRREGLALCRRLLSVPASELLPQPQDYRALHEALTAESLTRCPHCCGGVMLVTAILPVCRWPARPIDSS